MPPLAVRGTAALGLGVTSCFLSVCRLAQPLIEFRRPKEPSMGINTERDIEANMQIGPTDIGMVRIFIEADGIEIPMDFEPEEAEEIAEEILAAAQAARAVKP